MHNLVTFTLGELVGTAKDAAVDALLISVMGHSPDRITKTFPTPTLQQAREVKKIQKVFRWGTTTSLVSIR